MSATTITLTSRARYDALVAEIEAEMSAELDRVWSGPEAEVETLTRRTMDTLEARFYAFAKDGHPHQPSAEQWQALTWLARQLSAMATGHPIASRFMLSSLDPGVGKTQTLVAFIKTLLADPRYDPVGIVVFANRLDELYTFAGDDTPEGGLVYECFRNELVKAKEAGNFAVLTHDDKWNRLGCTPNRGRVLFTTQARLLTGARDKGSFSAITDFHYQGHPRQVRVWDETILPGYPITLDPDAALRLVYPIRTKLRRPDIAAALKADMKELDEQPADALYQLRDYEAEFGIDQEDLLSCVEWRSGDQGTATALWLLQGQVGVVRRDDYTEGSTVLSYAENLPDDLMPMLVLDASGRCRETYRAWIETRSNLVRGPEAVKDYGNLRLHHWSRGGGKTSWRKSSAELFAGIAAMIGSKQDTEEWLIVHHKPNFRRGMPNVPKRLREIVPNPERLSFVTWGAHSAVNRFSHIRNVVLAGILFLPDPAYEATARATIGSKPADQIEKPDVLDQIVVGEHRHAILQALCRGAVRASKGASCGSCEAWVNGSSAKGIDRELLRGLFPGARVADWTPDGKARPKLQYELAAEAITEWFMERPEGDAKLTPAEAMKLVGITDKGNFRRTVRQHPPGPAKKAPTAREARRADMRTEDERQEDLKEAIEPAEYDHPEDHPDVTVKFGTREPTAAVHAVPGVDVTEPATIEHHVVETGREILTEPFTGQRRVDPEDPTDPLAVATLETHIYRIAGDARHYILEILVDGRWQEEARGSEIGSLALKLAMQRVVISGEFHKAARELPLCRPLTLARRRALEPKNLPRLTPEQKAEANARIKAEMIQQRTVRAQLEREADRYGGNSQGYSWID